MVFVPKRHREQETAAADNGPVAAVAAAEPIAETPKPAEQPEIKSPADGAALQARLAEMQRAEELVQQRQQPQFQPPEPPPSIEQMIEGAAVPENAKAWLRAHPDYVSDLDKNQELRGGHRMVLRELGAAAEYTPEYFDRIEVLLGLKQETRPTNGNGAPTVSTPQPAPVRQQQYAVPVSAPISREAPSMSSGRAPSSQMRLRAEEVEIALASKLSPEEPDHLAIQRYAYNKAKGQKSGAIGPGARDGR